MVQNAPLRRSVDRKHLMRFQSETSVFKILRRSVDGGLKRKLFLMGITSAVHSAEASSLF